MFLNSRQNSFIFNFPKGFFPVSVEEKYKGYLEKMPVPFDTVRDFMNHTIQTVTFPTISMSEAVEQVRTTGFRQRYKNATNIQNLIARDFTVTFRLVEGYLNYWILFETMVDYFDFKNPNQYLPDISLRMLDNDGVMMTSIIFNEVMLLGMNALTLNYANTTPQFSQFTGSFKCNSVEIKLEIG
jgi:hypothetical protein